MPRDPVARPARLPSAREVAGNDGDRAGGLASGSPQLVERVTPQGPVPGNHSDPVAQALALPQETRTG